MLTGGLTEVARVGSGEDFGMAHGSGPTSSCPSLGVVGDTAGGVEQAAEVVEHHFQQGQIEEACRSPSAGFWLHGRVRELRSGGNHSRRSLQMVAVLAVAVVEQYPLSHVIELKLVGPLGIQILQLVHRWCAAPTPGSLVARSDTGALHPRSS